MAAADIVQSKQDRNWKGEVKSWNKKYRVENQGGYSQSLRGKVDALAQDDDERVVGSAVVQRSVRPVAERLNVAPHPEPETGHEAQVKQS